MADDDRSGIPDTVDGLLSQLTGIDVNGLCELGKGMGAMYNGVLEETGDAEAALGLTGCWITAVVQNPNGTDDA